MRHTEGLLSLIFLLFTPQALARAHDAKALSILRSHGFSPLLVVLFHLLLYVERACWPSASTFATKLKGISLCPTLSALLAATTNTLLPIVLAFVMNNSYDSSTPCSNLLLFCSICYSVQKLLILHTKRALALIIFPQAREE
ncbi:hypothetical protein FPSE5266_20339 [Fusarium pseudograminearum]|nr:hypothetical protein FPSE5266_20339 [Fusarium pseudograminearum]